MSDQLSDQLSDQILIKPSDRIRSMRVNISTFTYTFSQLDINSLIFGNNKVLLKNQLIIGHLMNSDLLSIKPSIHINPNDTPQQFPWYGYTNTEYPGVNNNAYIYMAAGSNYPYIANNIITLAYAMGNISPPPSMLTQNTSWLVYGNNWYNYSSSTQDYVVQQIIIYAAAFAYSVAIRLNNPTQQMTSMTLWVSVSNTHAVFGTINFKLGWPFQLTTLAINTSVTYNPNGSQLPSGLLGLTTLDESNMVNIFGVHMADVGNYVGGAILLPYNDNFY